MGTRKWQRFILIFIILVIVILVGKYKFEEWRIDKDTKIKATKYQKEEREVNERLISQLASKYNAIINWDNFPIKDNIYSIDLERVLKPKNERPLLILSWINDIITDGNKSLVKFNNIINKNGKILRILFVLEFNQNQLDQILKYRSDKLAGYAIVAHIKSVQKSNFSNDEGELEEGFSAIGQCIDFVYLKDGALLVFDNIFMKK